MKFEMEIADEARIIIESNMELCGMEEMSEYFDHAFSLLNCAILEANRGRKFGAIDEKNQEFAEINLPILNELADKRNK